MDNWFLRGIPHDRCGGNSPESQFVSKVMGNQADVGSSVIEDCCGECSTKCDFLEGKKDSLVPGTCAIDHLVINIGMFNTMEDLVVGKIANNTIGVHTTCLSLGITLSVIVKPASADLAALDLLEKFCLLLRG